MTESQTPLPYRPASTSSRPPLAIVGARVVPVTADPIENGTVVVEGGRITAIGAAAEVVVPEGATVVDAAGRWLVPGFIEAHGHVGIHEEGVGVEGNDTNEMTNPNTAGVRAIDAIDIDDEGFRDALRGGITSIVVKPGSGNVIGGRTVAIKSWGGRTIDEQLLRPEVSVKSALGENPKRVYAGKSQTPSTRLGVAYVLRQAFEDARHYAATRAEAATEGKAFKRDLALETLAAVLDGELVWDQHVHRHDDIATAIRLAEEFGYKLVVNHGTEGDKVADVLAEKGIPVIFGPMFTSRSKVELKDRAIKNLAALARAGVQVAITTDHPVVPIDFLVHQASLAVKEGLPAQTALEALTINPARILGLDDRVGALSVGLDGDLVLWSGDPLDVNSRAEHVFVEGVEVYAWDAELGSGRTVERAERFAG
ncbi:amidohydrolase [Schumannella luteola]|uniref:Imidazolonepropionase-like amidohydrolase n=1 Tax=Schumannella luteola TaxID=472059 RepID=A0A852YIH7_9MICO|nr:amidohydrolase [Schumannella luteola]NYG97579.1 imidazolonepropionase-like amidohydrolase [Schumannella luteola]TPX01572.1 amidohydrolase [Schumannella luteola]